MGRTTRLWRDAAGSGRWLLLGTSRPSNICTFIFSFTIVPHISKSMLLSLLRFSIFRFVLNTFLSSSPSASSLPFDILLGWIRIRVCCQPSFLCYLPFFVPYLPPSYICTAIPHHCSASIDLIPHIRTPHPSLLYNLPANERIESVLDLDMGDWCLRLQQGRKKELLLHGSRWWVRVYSRMPILR